MHPSPHLKGALSGIFQPFQIVYLEYEATRLYAEVVQIVETTQVCWVRPLMLAQNTVSQVGSKNSTIYDLRLGSDLLLPVQLFREALDLEVIPLLAELQNLDGSNHTCLTSHPALNQFVKQVCLAHPEAFVSCKTS